MSLIEVLVHTSLAEGLGWSLLHSLWEGALVAAVLAAVLWATKSPRIRYVASCLAMLAILCGFALTMIHVMPGDGQHVRAVETLPYSTWDGRGSADASDISNPGLAGIVPWLTPFWMLGVSLLYLSHVAGWFSVCRLRHRGVCYAPDRWQQTLSRLSAQLRVSRPIRLLESCLTEAPVVLGHFRPVILMPVGLLAGLPVAQVEAILLHELAHIRRYDYLVNLLQRSVEGLLFYHPAIWWITRVIRTERENCCDDVAVAMSGDAHEYAVALATLEQNRWSSREPAVAVTGGNLVKRIRRLLHREGPAGSWVPILAATILFATTAAVLAAWQSNPPQPNPAGVQRRAAEIALESPYLKWLDEDVVHIISKEESTAFLKLPTNEEREEFIQQFWLRRDPTPKTAANEFREEHYRRITYANARYATSHKSGWMTNRGRMYVQLGPPDLVEAWPSGGVDGIPFETWIYRSVKGTKGSQSFVFKDTRRTGDYQLVPNKKAR
ncbi:MAG: GWxTD domain-containing protein [Bryobacteraceae bacterium]